MGKAKSYIGSCKSQGVSPTIANALRMFDACGFSLCADPKGSELEDGYTNVVVTHIAVGMMPRKC